MRGVMSAGTRRVVSTGAMPTYSVGLPRHALSPSGETSTLKVFVPEINPVVDRGKGL